MDYRGAGILIYKILDKKIFFLLGKENLIISDKPNKGNKYSDFGGLRDKQDFSYIDTASREFYEETMGSFYSICEMKEKLINCPVFFNQKYKYYQFLLEDNLSDDKVMTYNKSRSYLQSCMKLVKQNKSTFYEKISCCPDGYVEKSEIRWFEVNEILSNAHIFRREFINSLSKILNEDLIKN